jgi:acetylornithine deacetylase/succinyl-diaminopimelate desuccinylase-like protein
VVVRAAADASTAVTGVESSIGVSMAGTVPMYQVCATHRVPCVTLGAGRADCRAHAPDENIRVEDLAAATRMMGRFIAAVAALPEIPRVP